MFDRVEYYKYLRSEIKSKEWDRYKDYFTSLLSYTNDFLTDIKKIDHYIHEYEGYLIRREMFLLHNCNSDLTREKLRNEFLIVNRDKNIDILILSTE